VSRRALTILIAAAAMVAAGFAAGSLAASRSASQLVVEGHVTSAGGRPVSGIKVWLNAWPDAATVSSLQADKQPVPVTVAGSAVTSATGAYAIRVSSPGALAADATNGVVKFSLMTGDKSGSAYPSFSRDLVSSFAGFGGTELAVPAGGSLTTNLRLMPSRG
jgi:hypothetical protein